MSKHTPGPWKAVKHRMVTNYWTVQAENEQGQLLPIAGMTCHHSEKTETNAQLIAAAPALLAACKQVRQMVADNCHKYACRDLNLIKLDAAIKLTEGKV